MCQIDCYYGTFVFFANFWLFTSFQSTVNQSGWLLSAALGRALGLTRPSQRSKVPSSSLSLGGCKVWSWCKGSSGRSISPKIQKSSAPSQCFLPASGQIQERSCCQTQSDPRISSNLRCRCPKGQVPFPEEQKGSYHTLIQLVQTQGTVFLRRSIHFSDAPEFLRCSTKIDPTTVDLSDAVIISQMLRENVLEWLTYLYHSHQFYILYGLGDSSRWSASDHRQLLRIHRHA